MKTFNKNIFLVGPASVGKTTVGGILAEKIGYNFIDIDKVFCSEIAPIGAFLEQNGYQAYCEANSALVDTLVDHHTASTVFATPAGFLAHEDSPHLVEKHSKLIQEKGVSVLLLPSRDPQDSVDLIVERQKARYPEARDAKERERYFSRFEKYKQYGNLKIFSSESPFLIAEQITLALEGLL